MRRHLPDPRRRLPVLVVATLVCLAPVGAQAWQERPSAAEEMLLGLIVRGREVIVVDGFFDGADFSIPVAAFLEVCDCRGEEQSDGSMTVSTGLGDAVLGAGDLIDRNGVTHITERALQDRLAVAVTYDASRLALILDLPWDAGRGGDGRPSWIDAEPDVRAPDLSLSSSRFRLEHARQPDLASTSGSMTLMGRAGGGLWRARYDDRFAGGRRTLTEYGWLRRFDESLLLLGHQRVNLHPLMGAVELTGVQGAWTNQPLELFVNGPDPSELLPRQLRATRTVTGIGVAAGTAVLRVDDRPVAAQIMGLDGRYEFRDVPVAGSGNGHVEVLVYERHDPTVPVDIHDHGRRASRTVLPDGALVMQGGVGRSGNLADPTQGPDGVAGFYQARVGVTDRLTVEGALQRSGGRDRLMVGGSAALGSGLAAGFAAARSGDRSAYMADLEGHWEHWRVRGRSSMRQAGFDALASGLRQEHLLEVSRRVAGGRLEMGMIALHRRGAGSDASFVLPWLYWRPDARLMLRARPDFDGRYRVDASWVPALDWRVGLSRSGDHTVADVSWRPGAALRTSLVAERTDTGAHREAVLLTWTGTGALSPSISAGPLLSNGRPGALISVQAAPVPGIIVGARFESSSVLERPDRARDQRLSLVVSGNLSHAGGGVLAGGYTSLHGTTGGVGGRLRVSGGYQVPAEALEGIAIHVDGRPVTRTGRGGRFHVASLPPGVHRLDLDPASLPVELTPRRGALLVEVVGGAVTRADLWLDVEFGIAGRVRVRGEPAAGLALELVDGDGQVVVRASTDRFGLYRLDGIPPGEYLLRAAGAADGTGDRAARRIVVRDDFLFEQDLDLDALPPGRS